MKLRYIVFLLGLSSTTTWAGGYDLANTPTQKPGIPPPGEFQVILVPPPQPSVDVTIYPGSLKANIERIAANFGWPQVIWSVKYDYHWIGKTQIHASSFSGILNQLLNGYPLQAIFYQGNHVLVINPRVLK